MIHDGLLQFVLGWFQQGGRGHSSQTLREAAKCCPPKDRHLSFFWCNRLLVIVCCTCVTWLMCSLGSCMIMWPKILWYILMVKPILSLEYPLIHFYSGKMFVDSGRSKHCFERQWFDSYLEMDTNLILVGSWHHSSSNHVYKSFAERYWGLMVKPSSYQLVILRKMIDSSKRFLCCAAVFYNTT